MTADSRYMNGRLERIVLLLVVCVPVPAFALSGLTIPLPSVVERAAAALVRGRCRHPRQPRARRVDDARLDRRRRRRARGRELRPRDEGSPKRPTRPPARPHAHRGDGRRPADEHSPGRRRGAGDTSGPGRADRPTRGRAKLRHPRTRAGRPGAERRRRRKRPGSAERDPHAGSDSAPRPRDDRRADTKPADDTSITPVTPPVDAGPDTKPEEEKPPETEPEPEKKPERRRTRLHATRSPAKTARSQQTQGSSRGRQPGRFRREPRRAAASRPPLRDRDLHLPRARSRRDPPRRPPLQHGAGRAGGDRAGAGDRELRPPRIAPRAGLRAAGRRPPPSRSRRALRGRTCSRKASCSRTSTRPTARSRTAPTTGSSARGRRSSTPARGTCAERSAATSRTLAGGEGGERKALRVYAPVAVRGRNGRRRALRGLRADREGGRGDVPPYRGDLRGRPRSPLHRPRADPPPRDAADPAPDGGDRVPRDLRRAHRPSEPDALQRPDRQAVLVRAGSRRRRSSCCSTSTASARSTTRSATRRATSCSRS